MALPTRTEQEPGELSARREALWRRHLAVEDARERHHRRRQALHERRRHRCESGDVLRAVLKGVGLYDRGRRNAAQPVVRRVEFSFDNLPPAFDGFTLLQLSDLHFDGRTEVVDAVAAHLQTLEADVCVLTGDYCHKHLGTIAEAVRGIEKLVPAIRSRLGIYAILGNHDLTALVDAYAAFGIQWLINRHAQLLHAGERVYLAGIDDNHTYRTHSLPLALHGIPEDRFRILLAHSPAIAREAAAAGVDLCLCGHTHAGQIRLPLVGAPFLNAPGAPRRACAGPWRCGRMQGYTSAGLGATSAPVRYNCPPEVVVIRLRRAAGT